MSAEYYSSATDGIKEIVPELLSLSPALIELLKVMPHDDLDALCCKIGQVSHWIDNLEKLIGNELVIRRARADYRRNMSHGMHKRTDRKEDE